LKKKLKLILRLRNQIPRLLNLNLKMKKKRRIKSYMKLAKKGHKLNLNFMLSSKAYLMKTPTLLQLKRNQLHQPKERPLLESLLKKQNLRLE
jgi:hypothetical protein